MTESEARSKIKHRIGVIKEIAGCRFDSKTVEDFEIAIQALKEIREYRAMEERLNGISVKQVVDGFIKQVENETQEEYKQGRILTNKEAEDWNEYQAIGSVEELKAFRSDDFTQDLLNMGYTKGLKDGYAKAIDEFAEEIAFGIYESVIWDMLATMSKNGSLSDTSDKIVDYVIETSKKIAEQLKGGATDE